MRLPPAASSGPFTLQMVSEWALRSWNSDSHGSAWGSPLCVFLQSMSEWRWAASWGSKEKSGSKTLSYGHGHRRNPTLSFNPNPGCSQPGSSWTSLKLAGSPPSPADNVLRLPAVPTNTLSTGAIFKSLFSVPFSCDRWRIAVIFTLNNSHYSLSVMKDRVYYLGAFSS